MMQAVTQFHENPRIIAWVQRPEGRLALWLLATALFLPSSASRLVPLVLGLTMLWPTERLKVLLFAAPLVALTLVSGRLPRLAGHPYALDNLISSLPAALLVLVFFVLCYVAAKNFQALPGPIRRHPLLALHLLAWCLIFASWQLPPDGVDATAWKVVTPVFALIPFIVWRCSYMLLSGQRGSAKNSSLAEHLVYALPLYGGTSVPYGKGHDYLKRCWASTPEALAKAQLAGLKLLLLYWLWRVVNRVIIAIGYGNFQGKAALLEDLGLARFLDLGITPLDSLIARTNTLPLDLGDAWVSLILSLVLQVLNLAITGHLIIGAVRLFGFNVFRNTYKPLLAESIVEFWNRYYYYFKELLLEFFFYPVYTRYFRGHQGLRIFIAIMAAACIGNSYYHLLRDISALHPLSFTEALAAMASRGFYTLLLGLGIYASMMAEKRRRGRPPAETAGLVCHLIRLRRIAGVWLFFALINIWNTHVPAAEFGRRSAFFFSLFGIDL